MRRALFRLSVLWACLGMALWFAMPPAAADSASVGTADESWYQVAGCTAEAAPCTVPNALPVTPPSPLPTSVPSLPAPIPTPSANPFPTGTLHIGIIGGQEQSRTYIKLDLSSLPFDAKLTGGTLILPVVASQQSGTVSEDMAHFRACFMNIPFRGGDAGVVAPPPHPDCTISAPAHLVTAQNVESFTINLAPFAERWSAGETNNGLALVATDAARTANETWQVAISGKGSGGPQIKAELSFVIPPPENFVVPLVPTPFAPAPAPFLPGPVIPTLSQPPVAQQPVQPLVAFATRGFVYAAIFLLPLAGLGLSGMLGYSLTREVVLPETRT